MNRLNTQGFKSFFYLASPFQGAQMEPEAARAAVSSLAADLIVAGLPIFCPIAHGGPIVQYGDLQGVGDHELWLPLDLVILRRSMGVIVHQLPGWDESKGVAAEIELAKARGLPIFMFNEGRDNVEQWIKAVADACQAAGSYMANQPWPHWYNPILQVGPE